MRTRREHTIPLKREAIHKAKILADKQETAVSGFIAAQSQASVQAEHAYEAARGSALELLKRGFHLGGGRVNRGALHERQVVRR